MPIIRIASTIWAECTATIAISAGRGVIINLNSFKNQIVKVRLTLLMYTNRSLSGPIN